VKPELKSEVRRGAVRRTAVDDSSRRRLVGMLRDRADAPARGVTRFMAMMSAEGGGRASRAAVLSGTEGVTRQLTCGDKL
jgi:hypothetical protein